MSEILNMSIEKIAGYGYDCACGKHHSVDINRIIVGSGAVESVIDVASGFKSGDIFLMADNNTYSICGERVERLLKESGYKVSSFIFNAEHSLVPDEAAMGRLLVEIEKDTSLIIAVGSGSLNDLARMMSCKMDIPYMIVATAPSMDGYASTVSPLIINGFKKTYEAVYPYAIIGDIDVLKDAPDEMLHAGFGDIIGKFTALADWELSQKVNGEYYCETVVTLMRNAIKKCLDNTEGIAAREPEAIGYIMEALILSGVAMGLVGNSRPASGAEHHLAHYWEMDALSKNAGHPLHGNSVGVGTIVISYIYSMLGIDKEFGIHVPAPEEISGILKASGACNDPASLGISREVFYQSVLHAMEIRPRYTVLQHANKMGMLQKCAEELTGRFYE